jgi:ubiquinol-cytochrome c reductase cytochrome b subunit
VETGLIKRAADGRFYEVHQPLGPVDSHGHSTLEYAGWTVPKKMNRVGALGPGLRGFFFPVEQSPDAPISPVPQPDSIAPGDQEHAELTTGQQ